MNHLSPHIRRFIARAQVGVDALSLDEKEAHYLALVALLPDDTEEADVAAHALAMIRAMKRAQDEFTQLLANR